MFGVSFTELIVIAVVALLVLGPEKLPELMYSIGTVLGKMQKEYQAVRREFYNSVYTPADEARRVMGSASRELVEERRRFELEGTAEAKNGDVQAKDQDQKSDEQRG